MLQAVSVYVSVLQTVLAGITSVDVFQKVTSAWTPTTEATILMRILVNNAMAERLAWKGCDCSTNDVATVRFTIASGRSQVATPRPTGDQMSGSDREGDTDRGTKANWISWNRRAKWTTGTE